MKAAGTLRQRCRHRPVQYLNNILEQDHRVIKRRVKVKQGFRAFHAEVPMFAQWDDHEVTNDWAPLGSYDDSGFAEDGVPKLVSRARRAFKTATPGAVAPVRARA